MGYRWASIEMKVNNFLSFKILCWLWVLSRECFIELLVVLCPSKKTQRIFLADLLQFGSNVNPDSHCSCLGVLFEMFLILSFFSCRQQLALTSYRKPCIWRIEQWVRFSFSLCSRNEGQHLLWWCTVLTSLGSTAWALISWLLPAWQVLWEKLPSLPGEVGNHHLAPEGHFVNGRRCCVGILIGENLEG